MLNRANLLEVLRRAAGAERVLDVGGWYQPLNLATHCLDIGPYATRRSAHALDPEDAERFTAATWLCHDACKAPWPFPDGFFDFAFCSHLLEDVRDPLTVCAELQRVAKAGYIETPSRLREIFARRRLSGLRRFLGRTPVVGFNHHRWLVERAGNHLRFTAKTTALVEHRARYLTREDVGRKLTEAESTMAFFWEGSFTAEEVLVDLEQDYTRYRREALAALRGRPSSEAAA